MIQNEFPEVCVGSTALDSFQIAASAKTPSPEEEK
jgi:hypothetical protein